MVYGRRHHPFAIESLGGATLHHRLSAPIAFAVVTVLQLTSIHELCRLGAVDLREGLLA
jgi:hypothetical protein